MFGAYIYLIKNIFKKMYSRSLFVLCIVRRFWVRCSYINDAYVERTIIQRVKRW